MLSCNGVERLTVRFNTAASGIHSVYSFHASAAIVIGVFEIKQLYFIRHLNIIVINNKLIYCIFSILSLFTGIINLSNEQVIPFNLPCMFNIFENLFKTFKPVDISHDF